MFKIRNKEGLFSTGGMSPHFTKTGKVWRILGHVNAHLVWLRGKVYTDCDLVEYETIEKNVTPMTNIVAARQEIKAKREQDYNDSCNAYKKEQRRKEYEKLKGEFG